jgi:hypothetical protein
MVVREFPYLTDEYSKRGGEIRRPFVD